MFLAIARQARAVLHTRHAHRNAFVEMSGKRIFKSASAAREKN
jgi:hypothetical protein